MFIPLVAVKVLQTTEMREKRAASGAEPTPSTVAELATLVRTETSRWAKVVKETGVTAD